MIYKLPVRTQRRLQHLKNAAIYVRDLPNVNVPETYVETPPSTEDCYDPYLVYKTLRAKSLFDVHIPNGECTCGKIHEVEDQGIYVCTICGITKDPVYVAQNAWNGTHTIFTKQYYDPCKYLDKHLQKCTTTVPHRYLRRIRAIFPQIFRIFFVLVPKRKNFMSYGFVIRKLLDFMGQEYSDITVPTIKTACKIKQCEDYWKLMLGTIDFSHLSECI